MKNLFKESDAVKRAKEKDRFLEYLLYHHNRGNIRLGNACDDLNISEENMTEIYIYLTVSWNPDYIERNDDLELWLNSKYVPNVREFLDKGGFTKIIQTEILTYNNLRNTRIISRVAICISVISLAWAIISRFV